MNPSVQAFFDNATNTVSYIVHDPATKKAAIIDPVLDFTPRNGRIATTSSEALLAAAKSQGLEIVYLLETHAHADHLSAAHHLREVTGAPVIIGSHITEVQTIFGALFEADDVTPDGSDFDQLMADGDSMALGDLEIRVMHTPGHTPACLTYLIGDAAFVGDTLFMPDYGTARADFPGGSAETLYHSIRKILELPPETRIFVGHDYLPESRSDFRWETTVAAQKTSNVHVRDGISEDEFVNMRTTRDKTLEAPQLILPSLQVNIRAGAMPPASLGGHIYLRLPVNSI
jgi:glyoxylase-like metal-dependent hydrolase (beta-lactamase superfamily II)